jgi:two-component system chemotaxis sensor kinase CheA
VTGFELTMITNEDQFLKSLRATFKIEANEHLETIAAGLVGLGKSATGEEQAQLVEIVFRAAHSLKGAARAVNFVAVEAVCQELEDLFAAWKRRESTPSEYILDSLHQALDAMSTSLAAPDSQSDGALASHVQALRNLSVTAPVATEETAGNDTPSTETAPATVSDGTEKTPLVETVRIGVAKLDARLLEAEEMLAAKLVTNQRASDIRDLMDRLEDWRKAWSKVQPEARTLQQSLERSTLASGSTANPALKALVDFSDWNHDYFRSLESKVAALSRTAAQDTLMVGKLVDDLLEDSKKLLMLPLSTLSGFFQKLVRDLCRDQGKQCELVIAGEEVEIDKRILEAMKDPLIHILRNTVDHGLESPEQRQRQGKPPRARITLTVLPLNDDKVEIVVADDGAGIDTERVKEFAVRKGVISSQDASRISDHEAAQLIFRADVSTSPIITQLSGRGLGLAIAREQTERLGGLASVESLRNIGTTIRITLPIALRTFRGILVEAAKQMFVVPTAQVERVTRFKPEDVQTVEGRDTLALGGRAVSLTHLAEVLELPSIDQGGDAPEATSAVILGAGDNQIAFAVDEVLDEQEVLVKRLSKPLARVRNITGATVLGSGQVVPILNVSDLLKSAKLVAGRSMRFADGKKPADLEAKSILVVEDSITSRMLLKGILESAGYQVKTAVDGLEGFTTLRTERFDLIVSDVEMPRLNGFDLTAKIRADQKFAELPVILVTALETREDRERGIDVGANAYLVKSKFDQSNLLEAVRRLA